MKYYDMVRYTNLKKNKINVKTKNISRPIGRNDSLITTDH